MDAYKKTIKKRILLYWLIALAAVLICILFTFISGGKPLNDFVLGFQFGIQGGLVAVALIFTVSYIRILSNDELLRRLYNREHDERLKAICAKAGMPTMWFSSVFILVAGLVAGYFNFTAFIVLISVAAFQLLLSVVLRQVYSKIM